MMMMMTMISLSQQLQRGRSPGSSQRGHCAARWEEYRDAIPEPERGDFMQCAAR